MPSSLDNDDDRNRCCCGVCRATTGATIFAILQFLFCSGFTVRHCITISSPKTEDYVLLADGLLGVVISIASLTGLVLRKTWLLVFQLIYSAIAVISLIVIGIVKCVVFGMAKAYGNEYSVTDLAILGVIVLIVGFWHVWVITLFLRAYRQLQRDATNRVCESDIVMTQYETPLRSVIATNNGVAHQDQAPSYATSTVPTLAYFQTNGQSPSCLRSAECPNPSELQTVENPPSYASLQNSVSDRRPGPDDRFDSLQHNKATEGYANPCFAKDVEEQEPKPLEINNARSTTNS